MKRLVLAGVLVAGLTVGPSAQQQPAQSGDGAASGRGAAPAAQEQGQVTPPDVLPQGGPQQPTFRGGINFVRVDVIVTDRKQQPVTDLRQEDFEIAEDGKPQTIEQFRLIKVDTAVPPPGEIARSIRSRDDEEREAAREDVRTYVFFLDDYHVRIENSMSVREPLTKFIETQLRPQDLVAVMYPLTPVSELSFTRNHEGVVRAIQKFEGRKFDYQPRNQFEYEYWKYPTETVERIRNDVVMSALEGLGVRLGGLGQGRKSIVFVSEGFTAMLPPQMRRADASAPANPLENNSGAGQDSNAELRAEWFAEVDVMQRLREVYTAANRGNASIYALDPRGLTTFEYGLGDAPAGSGGVTMATDRRALQRTQDTLRVLAEETDGRAIVNRNSLAEGLAQIARDSSYYYLIGYTTSGAPTDGKFHEIKVRVKRSGMQVRSRRGYWALSAADVTRVTERRSAPEVAKPIQQALATIAPSVRAGKYVQTWIGTERGSDGKTRVTFVWEPLPAVPGARREAPGRVTLLAATGSNLIYRGRSPEQTATAPVTGPQRIVFEAAPGNVELRITVEGVDGAGTLDQESRTIAVPDLTAPQAALGTPQVFRARNARDYQALLADSTGGVPNALREYSRSERLLIRFNAYGPGTEQPTPTAALLSRTGQKSRDLTVSPGTGGATHQIDLPLNTIAAGEYLVEITVTGGSGEAKEYVPLRIGV